MCIESDEDEADGNETQVGAGMSGDDESRAMSSEKIDFLQPEDAPEGNDRARKKQSKCLFVSLHPKIMQLRSQNQLELDDNCC
jgi:hypothetical protein